MEFPWSQLTKVQIPVTGINFIHLEIVLSELQNVEELRTTPVHVRRNRDKPDSSSPIRLPSLRLLVVSLYTHEILTWLEAPSPEDRRVLGPDPICIVRLPLTRNYHLLSVVHHAIFAD